MAICNALTTGLNKSCDTNAGGLNKIYITDYENVSGIQVSKSQYVYLAGGFGGDTLKETQTNQALVVNHGLPPFFDAVIIKLDKN